MASKWSGRMYLSSFHIHTPSAMSMATAETPEWIAPMMKYGAKMVECQPSTPITTAKSHDTMEWTETNTGRTSADSSMPAIACSFHCRGVPRQPRQSHE